MSILKYLTYPCVCGSQRTFQSCCYQKYPFKVNPGGFIETSMFVIYPPNFLDYLNGKVSSKVNRQTVLKKKVVKRKKRVKPASKKKK